MSVLFNIRPSVAAAEQSVQLCTCTRHILSGKWGTWGQLSQYSGWGLKQNITKVSSLFAFLKCFPCFFLLLLLLDVVKIAFLSLGDLSDPGITLEFPTSQANSLPSETPQKPQNFIPDRNYFVVQFGLPRWPSGNLPTNVRDAREAGLILGQRRHLEKEMAALYSMLALA